MRKIAITVVVIALFAASYSFLRTHRRNLGQAQSPLAPALSFADLNGNTLRLSDYKGRVLLVNFWAAWCGPCTAEIPQFVAMQQKYGPEGLQILGISIDDDERELRSFYRNKAVNYPVVIGNQAITDGFGGVLGLPTTFVIDRDGRIHAKQVGATDFSALELEVKRLLQSSPEQHHALRSPRSFR